MAEEQTNNVTQEQVSEPTTQEVQNQDTQAKPFEIPTEAQEFVGEGKKYKSAEEALRSVPHAQEHIKTLEEEMAQLKEELAKRRTAEELLDEMKSGLRSENTPQESFSQDKLMEMVNQTLSQRERQAIAKNNADSVAKKFTEQFGTEAETVYNSLAKDAGLTVQQLNNLASTSPNAVLKLAGIGAKPTTVAKTTSTVNTQALNAKPTGELSARVPKGASTKDLIAAWRNAGEKVKSQL